MWKLLLLGILLMAATVKNFTANQNDGTATSLATTIPATTAGNALVGGLFWKGATTFSSVTEATFADSGAGKIARPTDGQIQIIGSNSIAGGLTTITVNWSGSSDSIEAYFWEVQGQNTSTLFDAAFNSGTATSGTVLTTGSFTPKNGLMLSMAACDAIGSASGDTGYFVEYNPNGQGLVLQDKAFVSGAQTTSATFGNNMTKGAILSVVVNDALGGLGISFSGFHPGASPGLGGISSARFQPSMWWPYSPPPLITFDPATMAAMVKSGNDPLVLPPQVVASGMTPPEEMPT